MTPLVVRVLPDVAGISREFDYLVPEGWGDRATLGAVVRIDLNGRRVGGWITAVNVDAPAGVVLRPLAKISGSGPPAAVIDLARWASWRWAGRLSSILTAAAPPKAITALPPPAPLPAAPAAVAAWGDEPYTRSRAVVRLAPNTDEFPLVLGAVRAAAAHGAHALVVAPSVERARLTALALRRAGITAALYPRDWAAAAAGATVVGARSAAFSPLGRLGAALVLDEHDESYQEERSPTWHARDVVAERARRDGAPCVLASPAPTLEALDWGELIAPSRQEERAGWPIVDVIDVRQSEPGQWLSPKLVPALRGDGPVVCVLNRTGRSRMLSCAACGEIAKCDTHRIPLVQDEGGQLLCPRGDENRPGVCAHCGSTSLRNLRHGVARVREEIEALAGRPAVEVTKAHVLSRTAADLFVGTESVLHQVTHARAVIFLDFDQELLAPRYRAAEQALALLVRAARVVGPRAAGGRVLVQTRQPRHEVLDAAQRAEPGRLSARERARRAELSLPPFAAQALISGSAAAAFVERLGSPLGVTVRGPVEGAWQVSARTHQQLCDALAHVERPAGRLRIEVDPLRS